VYIEFGVGGQMTTLEPVSAGVALSSLPKVPQGTAYTCRYLSVHGRYVSHARLELGTRVGLMKRAFPRSALLSSVLAADPWGGAMRNNARRQSKHN
jgi:hypothetical protein